MFEVDWVYATRITVAGGGFPARLETGFVHICRN